MFRTLFGAILAMVLLATSSGGCGHDQRDGEAPRGSSGDASWASKAIKPMTPPSPPEMLLSEDQVATASSIEKSSLRPEKAFDGNTTSTRWGSLEGFDPQWLQVDLGSSRRISHVRLFWETAYARSYEIQISDDATNWRTIFWTTVGTGGTEDIATVPEIGRYVRMYGTHRGTPYGYSLYEMQVFGG